MVTPIYIFLPPLTSLPIILKSPIKYFSSFDPYSPFSINITLEASTIPKEFPLKFRVFPFL